MKKIPISKFKATCFSVLGRVGRTGVPVQVTRFGRPVADVVPPSVPRSRKEWIGSMAESGKIQGDIVAPAAGPSEWEALAP